MSYPRISIVTPSLNQVDTIESAMRSVLGQNESLARIGGWPVEYIVIDGGSTDGTCEVIANYRDQLAYGVSEVDRGQSHALNKGFAHATGDVVGWLNADDLLLPGALARVCEIFAQANCDVVCGSCQYVFADGRTEIRAVRPWQFEELFVCDPIHQPSSFWRRAWHEQVGGLDEQLHYGMDWDLWLKLVRGGASFELVDDLLSVYRITGLNKTSTGGDRRNREMYEILLRYAEGDARLLTELAYRVLWPLKRIRRRVPEWFYRPLSDGALTMMLVGLGPMFGFRRVRRCTHPFE